LILSKNIRRNKPQFDDFYKNHPIFIILVNIIRAKCGLKVGLIIFICKPNDGIWIDAEIETSEVRSAIWEGVLLCTGKTNSFSKINTSAPHDLDTIWLISWESLGENILLQPISKMKV
jgi:hypothetical protein